MVVHSNDPAGATDQTYGQTRQPTDSGALPRLALIDIGIDSFEGVFSSRVVLEDGDLTESRVVALVFHLIQLPS